MMKTTLLKLLSGLALTSIMFISQAAILDVTMQFKPDVTRPQHNQFENTTPVSGFCNQHSELCLPGDFSILIPSLTASKVFDTLSSDTKKNHVFFALDGTKKKIQLTNPVNGIKIEGDFRWAFFGVQHNRVNSSDGRVDSAMSGAGRYPGGGCTGRIGVGAPHFFRHGWAVPERSLSCYRRLNTANPYHGTVLINDFSIGYNLSLSNPLQIPAGDYEGELVYTVGEGMDVDFGADNYSEDEVRIRIKAKVEHIFFYDFPAGSERVTLSPPNGWAEWQNGGRIPDRLSKEVPFTLSASTAIRVKMQCEFNQGTGCSLKNTLTSEQVPLEVSMTLPGFTIGHRAMRDVPLNNSAAGIRVDAPDPYIIINRRSALNFNVKRSGVEQMVKHPGSSWKGNVTLMMESELN